MDQITHINLGQNLIKLILKNKNKRLGLILLQKQKLIQQHTNIDKTKMSPSQPIFITKQSIQTSNLAMTLKLSYCYLTFYIVQIVMAAFLCGLLFMDYLQLIAFVEVPIAFFIGIDMILSHFVENRSKTCGRFQITNMIVLLGSICTIVLDFSIPHITRNHVHLVFSIIRVMRFTMQMLWITKLVIESKRIIDSYQDGIIMIEDNIDIMDEQLTKMTL